MTALLFCMFTAVPLLATSTPITPAAVAVDAAGNLYIADFGRSSIRKIEAGTGFIMTLGTGLLTDGSTSGLAVDDVGNLVVADEKGGVVRRVDAVTGESTVIAENLDRPYAVAVDQWRNVYIAERGGHRIRKLRARTGVMTTVAGDGSAKVSGDGGPAIEAGIPNPTGVAVDEAGNIYIAEWGSGHTLFSRVRFVSAETGIITTVAGDGWCSGNPTDGGPATQPLCGPFSIAIGRSGAVFVTDIYDRAYVISPDLQRLARLAGTGNATFSGDGGPAIRATLNQPTGIAVDSDENIYIADSQNHRIRRIDDATGIITTIAGNGEPSETDGTRRAVAH